MADTYPITGIQAALGPVQGQVPLRQEIDAWYSNPANVTQVNLFFLAIARFQALPVPDKLSFWQVAGMSFILQVLRTSALMTVEGIHGQPLVPWDEETESQSPGAGYCTHNSILFPLWHRPYILLFEVHCFVSDFVIGLTCLQQRLYEIMRNEIIPGYPENQQAALQAAADTWRFPYWDWAQKKQRSPGQPANYDVPLIVKPANVDVLTPTGKTTIANPVYAFHSTKAMGDFDQYSLEPVGNAPV